MEKIAVFVDVQNIYYTVRQAYQCHFNYNIFWHQISAKGEIHKALAYAIHKGDEKQRQFQRILRGIGFEIKLKPYLQRSDGSTKGDWDVGITLDMLEYANNVDTVILASGDGDFDLAVHKLRQDYNVSVEIYGVPQLTASSLMDAASRFIPIEGDLLLKKSTGQSDE